MANRTATLPGVWAQTAAPVTVSPSAGTSYKDDSVSSAVIQTGLKFAVKPDTSVLNEQLYKMSLLISQMETQGILSWCATTTYAVGSLAIGSDSNVYIAIANGSANLNQNPTTATTFWKLFLSAATLSAAGIVQFASDAETQAGTVTTKAITPANLRACTATEARIGVVQLASTDEAAAKTNTTKAVTPEGLAAIGTGLSACLSTEAQVFSALAINTKCLTPLQHWNAFQGTNQSLAGTAGYQKFPGGMIMQWGYISQTWPANTGTVAVTFPVAFPSGVKNVQLTIDKAAALASGNIAIYTTGASSSGFTMVSDVSESTSTQAFGVYWFAVGL